MKLHRISLRRWLLLVFACTSSISLLIQGPVFAQSWGQLKSAASEAEAAKKYSEADAFWRKAIDACNDKTGPRYIQSLSGLAHLLLLQEKLAEAEDLYKKILALTEPSEVSDDKKSALIEYSSLLRLQKRESDAAALDSKFSLQTKTQLQDSSATNQTPSLTKSQNASDEKSSGLQSGSNDSKDWKSLSDKASKELSAKQFVQAEQSYKQARAIAERLADNSMLSQSLNGLISVYYAQNKLAVAEPLFMKCVDITRKSHGQMSKEYARALNDHANLLRLLNRKTEAIAEEARAEDILAKLKPESSGPGSSSGYASASDASGTRGGSILKRAGAAQGINNSRDLGE